MISAAGTTNAKPSLWRNTDFVALWSGQVVSALGTRVSATAMPLLVLATTGSPTDAGLVGAAGTLPFLVAHLPAGPLVDRWNRRRILLISEVAAGLALGTVPIALWLHTLTVAHLVVVAFVQGLCAVFFGLAEMAALPRIVPAALLPTALAQNEARGRGAALAGGPLGGLLFGMDRALPFLADAVSYAAASIALLFVRKDLQQEATAPAEPLWRATATGLRWIWRHPLIRAAILLVAASNLVFQALVLVIVVLAQRHGATAGAIGTMLGIYSGGGLLGALVASRVHRHFTPKMVIIGVNWIWVALLPLFLLTTDPLQTGDAGRGRRRLPRGRHLAQRHLRPRRAHPARHRHAGPDRREPVPRRRPGVRRRPDRRLQGCPRQRRCPARRWHPAGGRLVVGARFLPPDRWPLAVTVRRDGPAMLAVAGPAEIGRGSTLDLAVEDATGVVQVLCAGRLTGRFQTITVRTPGYHVTPLYARDRLSVLVQRG